MFSVAHQQVDKSLRKRLLITSIGIASIVSAISMVVAYRIAVDLGQSRELHALVDQADTLMLQLQSTRGKIEPEYLIQSIGDSSTEQDSSICPSIRLRVGDQSILRSGADSALLASVENSENFVANSEGIVSVDSNQYLWVERNDPQHDTSIVLVHHPSSLDAAMSYVISRLSITAFLTFWLAVWGALFLSALIIKQVKKHNETLSFLATQDPLTKLPNRAKLSEVITGYIDYANGWTGNKGEHAKAAFLVIDLDRFKIINDAMGHSMGDDVLIALATRLRTEIDEENLLVRIGGDEFVLWCPNVDADSAMATARQVIELCRRPIEVNQTHLELGASVGVASFPIHGKDVESLYRCADVAMFRAKKNRLGVALYDNNDEIPSLLSLKLIGELSSALSQNQFVLHYQPKIDLRTNAIAGVEALARWRHPTHGLIPPVEFIQLIEQSGLINTFSRYVLEQSVQQARIWMDQNWKIAVAVNLSPYNLADPELIPFIQSLLDKYQLPAAMLEIELTETAAMLDIESTKKVFGKLKKVGMSLSIDDYGTGMSSLAYLKELDADFIKIDRSFVMKLGEDSRDEAIVRSTIDLIGRLGKQAVAEGVETALIADQLREMGCRFGQGFYFAKPMTADKLGELMQSDTSAMKKIA